jgi:copper homeostasis protein
VTGFRLELSVDTLDDAVTAEELGADRIELCAAGALGGLTPSAGLLRATLERVRRAEVHVLIRPRDGGFRHTPAEVDTMVADVEHAVAAGAAGVVVGALTDTDDLDQPTLRELIAAAAGRAVTAHRALDVCRDPVAALHELVGLGVTRVLSSGQAARAQDGAALLARLVAAAGDRVAVMACGGVRPHNARAILAATGVRDLHAAPRHAPAATGTAAVDFGAHAGLDVAAARELVALARGQSIPAARNRRS